MDRAARDAGQGVEGARQGVNLPGERFSKLSAKQEKAAKGKTRRIRKESFFPGSPCVFFRGSVFGPIPVRAAGTGVPANASQYLQFMVRRARIFVEAKYYFMVCQERRRLAGKTPPKTAFPAKTIGNIVDAEISYSKASTGLFNRSAGATAALPANRGSKQLLVKVSSRKLCGISRPGGTEKQITHGLRKRMEFAIRLAENAAFGGILGQNGSQY